MQISSQDVLKLMLDEGIGEQEMTVSSPLISSGVVDSLDLVKLVALLEERFSLEIPDEDLRQENFETCESISRALNQQAITA